MAAKGKFWENAGISGKNREIVIEEWEIVGNSGKNWDRRGIIWITKLEGGGYVVHWSRYIVTTPESIW